MTVRITSDQTGPTVRFQVEADVVETDPDRGSYGAWRIRFYLKAINTGTSSSSFLNTGTQTLERSLGSTWSTVDTHTGNPFLPAVAAGATRWNEMTDVWVNATSNGYWYSTSTSMPIRMRMDYGSIDEYASGTVPVPRIASAPGAPGTPTVSSVEPTSAHFAWTAAASGSSPITDYGLYVSQDSTYDSPVYGAWGGTALSRTVPDGTLAPNTKYWARVRAMSAGGIGPYSASVSFTTPAGVPPAPTVTVTDIRPTAVKLNWTAAVAAGAPTTQYRWRIGTSSAMTTIVGSAVVGNVLSDDTLNDVTLVAATGYYAQVAAVNVWGQGAWSTAKAFTTIPATPPGLAVASTPSGTSSVLTFSPPSGVTGVTAYRWERWDETPGIPIAIITGESASISATVTGAVPGRTYKWRAAARISSYQSPWTAWLPFTQLKPNVNAGDYFDGATPDVADINYQWGTDGSGAPNASISTALASGVDGWQAVFANGAGVIYRITSGTFGFYAARVQVTVDATSDGQRFGQNGGVAWRSQVTADTPYVGSIHTLLSRMNRVAAEISWYNAAGGLISRSVGASTEVPGSDWFRLTVGATSPAGAEWAAVNLIDVNGAGWTPWHGGDVIDIDAAMLTLNELFPYFDGNTPYDGDYVYEWELTPNASVSTRTPIDQVDLDTMVFGGGLLQPVGRALIDPDCTAVPAPPRPPTVPSDCIDEIGVWRRYYTEIPANLVPDWLDVVPTLEITSGAKAARQVRIRYYPNPGNLPPSQVNTSTWLSEQIISYMPAATELTLNGMTQHVTAEINGGNPINADHLMYGTKGRPATWPVLSCGISYLVSVEVPITEPAGNITVAASLTART